MTQKIDNQPKVKRESKNKIRVEFERTSLKERLKTKYLSMFFLKNTLWFIFRLLLLIGIAFVVIQPFITMVIQSIMAPQDFADDSVMQVPRNLSMVIYKGIIQDLAYFEYFFETFAFSLICALLQTFSCCLIGYGLAKFKFRGNKLVFFAVILTLVIPHGTLQSALYFRFRYFDVLGIFSFLSGNTGIGWIDNIMGILPKESFTGGGFSLLGTWWPLILMSIFGLAFKNGLYIFMLRQFFRGVPDELEESAYLDGANTFRTFVQVILPLSVPMMVTVFLFAFCWQWTDDFYVPLFFDQLKAADRPSLMYYITDTAKINSSLVFTAAKEIATTKGEGGFGLAIKYGCGLMACTPLIILYLFCQRQLVQGIERSGIVG
ncbi:MAG: carbohydrate ABC transporter permease [Clostridia bacterium]|nr:carbohydrate ABC transporter permease [Clostridia bacterium]